jgi:hypothetical protein
LTGSKPPANRNAKRPFITGIGSAFPCTRPRRTKTSPGCEIQWAGSPPPRGRRQYGSRCLPIRARVRHFLWLPFGKLPSSYLRLPPPRTQFQGGVPYPPSS